MYLQILAVTILAIVTIQAFTITSSSQILQLPTLDLELANLNLTHPILTTSNWPPTPFKADIVEPGSYVTIQAVTTRQTHNADLDELVCDSIQNIIRKKFSRRSSVKAFVKDFHYLDGHVSFTFRLEGTLKVRGMEVVGLLRELWFLTSEHGAATVFATYFQKGVEAAEVGLLLN